MTVSDTPTYLSSSVLAILHKFFDIGISEKENIKHELYWTDSPTSQYRNRFILHTIAIHIDMFGFKATWNYFEAGHGKVMVKLAPDRAVNSGKHVKQGLKTSTIGQSNLLCRRFTFSTCQMMNAI